MCMLVEVAGERSGLLSKVYENPKYNAAFDRCIDVMAKMMQKYGNQVLYCLLYTSDAPDD